MFNSLIPKTFLITMTHSERLQIIQSRINTALSACRRPENSVQLMAVSKTKPASNIASLYQLGQRHFGENYLQEALAKQRELAHYAISWHFIGPIQSNKTKALAQYFSWVHSVDRIKIAKRLNEQRPTHLPPLNICLQINISDETSKSGVQLQDLAAMIEAINQLPHLKLRGVMAIPEKQQGFNQQREPYQRIYRAITELHQSQLDTFSFGMSNDLEAAIAEGSTIVRIGTALFGERQ